MLLAIDTATRSLTLALHDGQQVVAEMTWTTPNQHTVELMPAVRQLLERSQLTASTLTLLAVSQGPGSFNGLRIGFSLAKGLAMSLDIPLVAIPTLDITASAQPCFDGTLIAVIQVGRGRICRGSYQWDGIRWIGQDDLKIMAWQEVLENIVDKSLIAGEIDAPGRAEIEQAIQSGKPIQIALPAQSLRRAGFLAELAWARWRTDSLDQAATATPLYLHQPGVPHP
jgi:tRNA threonylcarbamoyladenosine biosynthesis protein TsaB